MIASLGYILAVFLVVVPQLTAAHGAYYLPGVSPHTFRQYENVSSMAVYLMLSYWKLLFSSINGI